MALKYKPTTAKYKGRTKTLYIYYESRDRVRGGKVLSGRRYDEKIG